MRTRKPTPQDRKEKDLQAKTALREKRIANRRTEPERQAALENLLARLAPEKELPEQQQRRLTNNLSNQVHQELLRVAQENPNSPNADVDALLSQNVFWNREEAKNSPNNQTALIKTQILFIKGFASELILAETGVPFSVFQWHAFKKPNSWYHVRRAVFKELTDATLRGVVSSKLDTLSDIMTLSLEGLKSYVAELATGERRVEGTREAKLLSDILANIHRIAQLEQGKPTTITENMAHLTPDQLRQRAIELFKDLEEVDGVASYSNVKQPPKQ